MSGAEQTVQLELLFNNKVFDLEGRVLGRIEEVIGEEEGDELFVTEYHTGGMGFIEHLSTITVGSWLVKLLGTHKGYVIRWDQLDLTDPEKPRINCPRSELAERE
jgi:hypothetical protein